jgi:hypothetical protein
MVSFYEVVGRLAVYSLVALLALLLVSLLLGVLLIKKKKLLLPRLLLFTMDALYLQFKKVARAFGLSEKLVDAIGIEVRNHLNREKFARTPPSERILVVPQCIRHIRCPARLDAKTGISCKDCGMCIIKDLKAEAERLGYKFYIVPGGSFVKRIIKATKPKAALGVACHRDLNMGMHEISRKSCAVMGVPLLKDGCVETEVNLEEILRTMRLGIEEVTQEASRSCSPSPQKV